MASQSPVTDWVNDFDHTDPRWTEDPFPIWDELRGKCPVAHTDRFLGVYLPTTFEAVKQISYDTEHFSSRRVVVRNVRPEVVMPSPPITSDPPLTSRPSSSFCRRSRRTRRRSWSRACARSATS